MIRVTQRPNSDNAPEGYAAGTTIVREKEIWSFTPLGLLRAAFAPIALDGTEFDRAELEANPDQRRVVSWLLRRHFERYLTSLIHDGTVEGYSAPALPVGA